MKHPGAADVALYAGGDCGLLQRWRIRRHMSGCEGCRRELRAQESAQQALREYVAEMPAGVDWDRLAHEMKGNIRVGLAAGECVGDFPLKQRVPILHWNIAMSLAMLVMLLAAAFAINNVPAARAHVLTAVRRLVGMDSTGSQPIMTAAPSTAVVEASPQLIVMRSNGSALSVVPEDASEVRVSVNLQGSASARSVDADTGQVTISRVYDAQ